MSFQLSKFTLRTNCELLKKFRYVAEYNASSANREMEVLIKKYVDEFEKSKEKLCCNIDSLSNFYAVILPSYRF